MPQSFLSSHATHHAISRAWSRYGLNQRQVSNIANLLLDYHGDNVNDAVVKVKGFKKKHDHRVIMGVVTNDQLCLLLWDKKDKVIVTFFPPEGFYYHKALKKAGYIFERKLERRRRKRAANAENRRLREEGECLETLGTL